MPLLVVQNLSWTLPILQCLHDLSRLRILHLLPQILDHSIYILCVAYSLREAISADHFGSQVIKLLKCRLMILVSPEDLSLPFFDLFQVFSFIGEGRGQTKFLPHYLVIVLGLDNMRIEHIANIIILRLLLTRLSSGFVLIKTGKFCCVFRSFKGLDELWFLHKLPIFLLLMYTVLIQYKSPYQSRSVGL